MGLSVGHQGKTNHSIGWNEPWSISYHLNIWRALLWWLGGIIIRPLVWLRSVITPGTHLDPVIFTVRRGGRFITQLRIQWLRMRQAASANIGKALTIQLLGSIDDFVSPTDNIDLISGGDFVYLDVPHSGHSSVIDMSDPVYGPARCDVLRMALTAPKDILTRESLAPQDNPRSNPEYEKQNVVFVVHGIRDEGYWTNKLARKVILRAKKDDRDNVWGTETSTYGFFPMLPFLMAQRRREKVEWLMDQYAELVARCPNARFHYVGHSNGTYCLAKALELYSCCQFERVVFAGSVVRTSFDWSRFLPFSIGAREIAPDEPQVRRVLNYVATADLVVAGFPKIFQYFPFLKNDLGSAGFDGFNQKATNSMVTEVEYVRGGHGAAIKERNWDTIAEFIYSGKLLDRGAPEDLFDPKRPAYVQIIGRIPLLAWLCAITAALLGGTMIGWITFTIVSLVAKCALKLSGAIGVMAPHGLTGDVDSVAFTLAVITAIFSVFKVITKL